MISILCPTRKRPVELHRMVHSVAETVFDPTKVEIILYIDEDDRESALLATYLGLQYGRTRGIRIAYQVGPRITLTDCWNQCLPKARGDIYLQGNDDLIMRTRFWDLMVGNIFAQHPDRILMVHGNDLGQHFDKFGAHCFVHQRWVDTLGYFIPPWFSSDYGDTWLNEIANALDRRRYLPMVIEHMHFLFGKAVPDQTTDERLARHKADDCDKIWNDKHTELMADIAKLRPLLGTPWVK